jgi:hypothetical protein
MKIVMNTCYGGFNLSMEALRLYFQRKGKEMWLQLHSSGFVTISRVPWEKSVAVTWSAEEKEEKKEEYDRVREEETFQQYSIERNDSALVHIVETLGPDNASGPFCRLKVVEIPDGVEWIINDDDGKEWVAEKHRTWR